MGVEEEVFPIGDGKNPEGWSWICHDCRAVGRSYPTRSEAADAFWAHWPTDPEPDPTEHPNGW